MPNLHLRDGEIGIAHLSDLHFGVGGDKDVWKLLGQILQEVRPELLLVSGDLADTPSQTLFEAARDGLDGFKVPYRVCLGNHDRFIKGIRLKSWQEPLVSPKAPYLVLAIWLAIALGLTIVWPAWYWAVGAVVVVGLGWLARMELFRRLNIPQDYASFHDTFHGTCLKHDAAEPVTVGGWQLGLLGVDSCTRADFYARGYVPATVFQPLRNATRGKQFDLCICLVHHHLLSVRKLEHERQNNPADLKNTTGMVNAGCLLEALAAAHVDLVLHGHEHRDNWASYGSLDGGSGAVRVVAAGSATGAHNIKGWSQSEMTFNLLILRPDRTVRLRRYYYQTNEWKRDPDVPLFDAAHLRHARLRRQMAASGLGGEVVCGITKYVEFTRERDIWVYWYYTDWQLPGREFVQPIRNSTGAPGDVGIDVYWAGNPEPYVASAVSCKRVTGKYDTWEIRWPIPDVIPRDTPVRLVLTYCWRAAAC